MRLSLGFLQPIAKAISFSPARRSATSGRRQLPWFWGKSDNGFPDSPNISARLTTPARRQRGFTLVELMVVLVIVALIMALVGISMSRSVSSAEARAASRKLVSNLRYTRARAVIDKKETVFLVDIENRAYQAPGRKRVNLPDGVELTLTTARSEMTSEDVGGIRFFPDGGSTGGHIELTVNEREYRINVAWLTGEASLQREEG